jgi:hypothetical protein
MFLLATSLLSVAPLLAARRAHGQTASTTAAPAVHASRNRWEAVLHYALQVPFTYTWSGPATQPVLALYNGVDSIISTRVVRAGDSVVVHFDHLAALLRGVITGGSPDDSRGRAFVGWWVTPRRGDSVRVTAEPPSSAPVPADANATQRTAPDVHGTWLLAVSSAKGKKAWRLVVTQRSPRGPARVYVAWREAEQVARGLEVVALDFEDAEELQDLARVRAFVRRYGVTYPYLIAVTPREVAARIPRRHGADYRAIAERLLADGR